MDHNIIVLAFPPHTTHKLQSLDVCGFPQFKHALAKTQSEIGRAGNTRIDKSNIISVIYDAYTKAFTLENIMKGFELMGVHPYNPAVITPEMMAPSTIALSRGGFTVEDPDYIKLWSTLMHPDTNNQAPPQAAVPDPSPIRKCQPLSDIDSNIDPKLLAASNETPTPSLPSSKWPSLLRSTSASFLVNGTPTHSSNGVLNTVSYQYSPYKIPLPLQKPVDPSSLNMENLVACCNALEAGLKAATESNSILSAANEKVNVQLVLQKEHLVQLNSKLYIKEVNSQPKQRLIYHNGQGQVLTTQALVDALEAKKTAKEQEELDKKQQKQSAALKKQAIADEKAHNKELRADYHAKKELYNTAVQNKVPVDQRPEKPVLLFPKGSKSNQTLNLGHDLEVVAGPSNAPESALLDLMDIAEGNTD